MRALLLALLLVLLLPLAATAQSVYGQRLVSRDGRWLLPVASRLQSSDAHMHVGRGSVLAWDLNAPQGSAVYPVAPGTVIYAGCNNSGGYGCWTLIDHDGGYRSIMGHMIQGSLRVRSGDLVAANTIVGQVGWTGMTSFGPHVHLEIHHAAAAGGRIDPAAIWDETQMVRCDKCPSGGGAPVVATGVTRGTAIAGASTSAPLWWFFVGVAATVALLGFVYSPRGWFAYSLWHGASMAIVVFAILLWQTSRIDAGSQGRGDWQQAYRITIGSEGWACTHDPVRTMGGVTQGTYDAWRMRQGLGPADVCGGLTEQQRQAIFVERYWRASGADRLPAGLALTHADFAFNAGVGAAGEILSACGNDVRCYNDRRESFYRSARGCALYCAGWLNRLERIRKVTEVY